MSEERKRILNMLSAGKINAEEAEQLLDALGSSPATETAVMSAPARKGAPKYLRVTVDAPNDADGGAPEKVNVRVPIQLLRAGMKFAALIPPGARGQVDQALHDKGIQFSLADMTPEMLDELISNLEELVIDVDGRDGSRVRVFCEG